MRINGAINIISAMIHKNAVTGENPKPVDERLKAELILLMISIGYGLRYIAIKQVVVVYDIFFVNAIRYILALLFSVIFLRRHLVFNKVTVKVSVFSGATLSAAMLLQTYALKFTGAGKASFLSSVYLILIPFLIWLIYRIRPAPRNLVAAAVCIAGVALMSLNADLTFDRTDLILLLGALCAALSMICVDKGSKMPQVHPLTMSFCQLVFSALIFITLTLVKGGYAAYRYPPDMILYLFFIGFICAGMGNPLWMKCVKHTTAPRFSVITATESVFATVFGILLLHEIMSLRAALGAAAIFVALVITVSDKNRPVLAPGPAPECEQDKPLKSA